MWFIITIWEANLFFYCAMYFKADTNMGKYYGGPKKLNFKLLSSYRAQKLRIVVLFGKNNFLNLSDHLQFAQLAWSFEKTKFLVILKSDMA